MTTTTKINIADLVRMVDPHFQDRPVAYIFRGNRRFLDPSILPAKKAGYVLDVDGKPIRDVSDFPIEGV